MVLILKTKKLRKIETGIKIAILTNEVDKNVT